MTFALARLGEPGHERPFAIVDGVASSIESLTADIDGAFLDNGGVARVRAALADGQLRAAARSSRSACATVRRSHDQARSSASA